ncbi:MAG: 4-hydroxy-tetrahydrodipicolinate synthase [ANME-2 cluster archaeon]|nr:4-hydroxy-tetrahydrodipicolinate synthase [ANME-2 cluster archaeon]MDF1558261.1 4-hydroxy-tetrahydrodipicolinate synthase [ANME-2 cluster archaeon]
MLDGVLVALITPFTQDDVIDENGVKSNIEFLVKGGVSGIVPSGTTGESATLTFQEHKDLIELTVDCSSVPVVAGTGSNSTAEALDLTKFAADAGADAALLITPYYNKPNDEGLLKHFTAIADNAEIPQILYNVPTRTCINMKPEVTARLAQHPNIIGIKEASGDLDQISETIKLTRDEDFVVYSGDDAMTLPIMELGGVGVISVTANIVPDKMVGMVAAFKDGDMVTAKKLEAELAPLIDALFLETNPIPVKKAAELIGLAAGHLRLPLAPISPENEARLRAELKAIGAL